VHPSESTLAADYDAYLNELVQVSGTIVQTDPVIIIAEYHYYAEGQAYADTLMPDLLTHAFIAYTICTLLSWRYAWLAPTYVTVGMAGAFIPDLAKIGLVLHSVTVAVVLDLPFDWFGIHTLGGTLVGVLIGVTVAASPERRRVFVLLALGSASHLVADALLVKASGRSYAVLWPLAQYYPPTPGLYLSTDIWPSLVTGLLAVVVWLARRRRTHASS